MSELGKILGDEQVRGRDVERQMGKAADVGTRYDIYAESIYIKDNEIQKELYDCDNYDDITQWYMPFEAKDALTPTLNAQKKKKGNYSMTLGVDVSQDASTFAKWVSTKNYGDLSLFTGQSSGNPDAGSIKIWTYANSTAYSNLQSTTALEFDIGSSGANMISFKRSKASTFNENNWKEVELNLTTGTVTGTPDWTAIDLSAIKLNETGSPSDFEVYIDDIRITSPATRAYTRTLGKAFILGWGPPVSGRGHLGVTQGFYNTLGEDSMGAWTATTLNNLDA